MQVYLVSKCRVCSALVSMYGSQASVLVKCCNLKSQVLNKSYLFSLLFNNLVSELPLTQQSSITVRRLGIVFVVSRIVFLEVFILLAYSLGL